MIEDIINFIRNVRLMMLLICCLLILLHTPLHSHLNVDMPASNDQFEPTNGKNKHHEKPTQLQNSKTLERIMIFH